ncbi:MAG: S-methyl-5-thioribose-1-phosphate isomerase [Candidatus ainarchaeum sp.]|nr:S-methyl-5-thioribose-1-phosphate isomerase [Candidatus ainarchaeum sp.]
MRSVDFRNGKIFLLDQRKLPYSEKYIECKSIKQVFNAIKNMVVRGAPAIGVAAAYGLSISKNFVKDCEFLRKARPTAVDLNNAIEFMIRENKKGKKSIDSAKRWHKKIIEKTKKISENGASLIKSNSNILLHCNAGMIATAGEGTALGAVVYAKENGKKIFVYVNETRPRIQGALTSWELGKNRIKHRVIVDSSAGFFMENGKVDCVFVGADRVLKNGDFANKIGTYSLAVIAKENKIPFYVCFPISTFDSKTKNGKKIKIEERSEKEVLEILGKKVYGKNTKALNPAFDITPSKYVTAYITEYGIHKKPKEIGKIWKNIPE